MTKGAYRNRRAGANVEGPATRGGGRSLAPLSVLFLAQKMLTELSHREDTTAGLNPDALDPLRDPFHCQDRSARSHDLGVDYLPARLLANDLENHLDQRIPRIWSRRRSRFKSPDYSAAAFLDAPGGHP